MAEIEKLKSLYGDNNAYNVKAMKNELRFINDSLENKEERYTCSKCFNTMRLLQYASNDHYETTSYVCDVYGNVIGDLIYCPKCGEIKIDLKI